MSGQPTTDGSSIELRVTEISQLFHTLDPFPFRDKDLDKEVRSSPAWRAAVSLKRKKRRI